MFAIPRPNHAFAHACGLISLILAALVSVTWADPVKISFVPPPMEGTISMGIYDPSGKLVRMLHREAEPEAFTQAEDALQTQWDGKDDQGNVLPAGSYRAKGVMVGDLGVSGEDYIGNDWVTEEDSPHIRKITDLAFDQNGVPVLSVTVAGEPEPKVYDLALKAAEVPGEEPEVRLSARPEFPKPAPTGLFKEWGVKGQPDDPPAVKCAAAGKNLYVLYENEKLQRLRGYDFAAAKPGEAPKVLLQKDIIFSDSYEQIAPKLTFPDGQPFAPSPELKVALVRNPLLKKKQAASLSLRAIVYKEGAWIGASDGLPLCKVSDTPNLRWAVFGWPAPKKPITFFTSDGAAVEEYQVSAVANMMTFDAGAHQWAPPAPSPSPTTTPGATPMASPSPSASPL